MSNAALRLTYLKQINKKRPKVAPKDVVKKWRIFPGDKVMVMAGDDKGKVGTVIKCLTKENKVLVSGVNLVCTNSSLSSFSSWHLLSSFLCTFKGKKTSEIGWRQTRRNLHN
jgi:hypothetical protein